MRKKFLIVFMILYGLGIFGNLLTGKLIELIFGGLIPAISLWFTYKYVNQLQFAPTVDGP
jgi:hypothetical protein